MNTTIRAESCDTSSDFWKDHATVLRREAADGHGEALLRQFLHQVRKPHPGLAQQVFLGHPHVLEK